MLLRPAQLIGKLRAKRLAAGLVGVLTLLISGTVMASPAMAVTVTTTQHQCEQIGGADKYGNTAYICTDLLYYDYGNNTYQYGARTEAFCKDVNDVVVRCANITVVNEAAYATSSGTHTGNYLYDACGHSSGLCPAGPNRFYVTNDSLVPLSGPACSINNAWAVTNVTDGSGFYRTSIQLPTSGITIDLPANFGTYHDLVYACG
jgi:hypothetical protein